MSHVNHMKLNIITQILRQVFKLPEKATPFVAIFPKTHIQSPINIGEIYTARKIARANRLAVTSADLPPCTDQERQEAHANNLGTLADLWHAQNITAALSHTEMRVHLLKIIIALYRDETDVDFQAANDLFADAVDALTAFSEAKKHGTPQENRMKLQAVEDWFNLLFTYSEFVPAAAFDAAAIYNTGLQIITYHNRLMTYKPEYVAAAFNVIHGSSIESVATKYQLKQSEVRTHTLLVGQILYRLGFICTDFESIKPAETIPQLRSHEYVELANLARLMQLIKEARHKFCESFERHFGISQIDWQKYEREVGQGLYQIGRLLNPVKSKNIFQAA